MDSKQSLRRAYALRETMMAMPPPRILLAEDDCDLRRVMAGALREQGYSVIEAQDGRELVEHVGSALLFGNVRGELEPVALVISDIRMPGPTGLDVLARLREASVEVAVILVTAHGDPETRETARRLRANVIIHKPFDLDLLLAVVEDFLPALVPPEAPASWRVR